MILPSYAAYAPIHVALTKKAIKHCLGCHRLTTVEAHLHPVAANPYREATLPVADPQRLISGLHHCGVCHPSVLISRLTRSSEVSIPGARDTKQNSVIMFQTVTGAQRHCCSTLSYSIAITIPSPPPYLVEISRM